MADDPDTCAAYAPFFGFAGASIAMILSETWHPMAGRMEWYGTRKGYGRAFSIALGAAIGTAKSGVAIAGLGTFRPDIVMKSLIPVVMAGIIAIYGLVVAVLISGAIGEPGGSYSLLTSFVHLAAGLSVGFGGVSAGLAIGVVGDACVRAIVLETRLFVGMVLILIFAEVLGLYGLIVSLILNSRSDNEACLG